MTHVIFLYLLLPWACREHAAGEQRLVLDNSWRAKVASTELERHGYMDAREFHRSRTASWRIAAAMFDPPEPPHGQLIPRRKPAPAVAPPPVQPLAPVIVPVAPPAVTPDASTGWIAAAIAGVGGVASVVAGGLVQWLARRRR